MKHPAQMTQEQRQDYRASFAGPHSDALDVLRQTRSDMRSICRSAKADPDSLRGFLAPYARSHYRRARATAMRQVRLP